jgi:hypothetical protein
MEGRIVGFNMVKQSTVSVCLAAVEAKHTAQETL